MGYRYHTETAPLVRFEFIGRLSAEDMDRYFADAKSLLVGGRPHAVVVDTRTMLVPEVEFVRRQANWLRDNQHEIRQLDRGIAIVVPSALIRGLVRAIMHFQEFPTAHALFDELDDATAWAQAQLAK